MHAAAVGVIELAGEQNVKRTELTPMFSPDVLLFFGSISSYLAFSALGGGIFTFGSFSVPCQMW